MKKILLSTFGFGLLAFSFVNAAILQDAIQWGYDEGLTSFSTSSTFRPNDTLRRDESAKFFVEFARLQNTITNLSYNLNCDFRDINLSRSDLRTYVSNACQMGFLKGSNGHVMPDQRLTNAQAITIVVRILDNGRLQSETNVSHRADNYYKRAQDLWLDLTHFWSKDTATTRGNVMMLLYAASGGRIGTTWNNDMDRILQELLDILNE